MTEVKIYTDGACSGNPGRGGWCAIVQACGHEKIVYGGDPETTNNRMELLGVINGLKTLNRSCQVTVITDSKYVCDAFNKGWLINWQKNGWRKADKKPVLNMELWKELLNLTTYHKVSFEWVQGHAGHPQNERCDHAASMIAKGKEIDAADI